MRGQVAAGVAQPSGLPGEHELRADAVRGRREQPLVVEREEAREPAQAGPTTAAVRVDSAAARSRSTTASAASSDTPAFS